MFMNRTGSDSQRPLACTYKDTIDVIYMNKKQETNNYYKRFTLLFQLGDLQSSYNAAKRSVDAFQDHVDSKDLLKQLKHHFSLL